MDTVNLFDPDFQANPHAALARLRMADPVHRSPLLRIWLITRHADVVQLGRDPRCGRDLAKLKPGGRPEEFYAGYDGLIELTKMAMFHLDPPNHTRIRNLMAYAFTPRAIQTMKSSIETIADGLLAAMPTDGSIDLIRDFAKPLPVTIICDLLGVPPEDFEQMGRWSDALAETVEVTITTEQKQAADAAYHALVAYLDELVGRHRSSGPSDTLVGRLIAAERETEALSARELLVNILFLLIGGHETTTNLIGNGMLSLLRNSDQLDLLRREPELMDSAVEEMLRYECPVNTNARVPHEDIELGGKTIRAGQLILCMLGAANRDPEVFADPDRFDIRRNPNPHQAFGGGPHFCIGAHLSRLEARIGFRALLGRYATIELDEGRTRWGHRVNLRGLTELGLNVRRTDA